MAFGITVFAAASCLLATRLIPDSAASTAVLFSALLATANALLALLLSHVGLSRSSTKAFFGAIIGGMFFRMAATLAGFVAGLKVLLLPPAALTAALLTYTGLFMAAEVALWSWQDFSGRTQAS